MRLPRPRLLTRVALALAAVGLLPLAISYFGLVGVNRDALFDQVLNTHALAARTAAARVEAFLEARLSLARGLAANRALADPRSPAAQELLAGSLQAWSDLNVEAVAIVNAWGEEVVRAQLKGMSPAVTAALRLPAAGPVAAVPGELPPVIRIAAPLPGGAGAVVLACGGVALQDVAHPDELGGEAELAVADPERRVVVGDARSLAPFPRSLVDAALAGRVAGASRFRGVGGEEVLGAYAPVPLAGWVVLSSQPARVAEAVAARLRWQSVKAFGASLLLIALLLAAAWAAVVRPVRDLARAQRELAGAAPLPAGRDEIDDLRRSFEALRRGLDERRALDDVFLGRYQVIELLATGGMGAVFRGWDPRLQRPVALKTLRLAGVELPPGKRAQRVEQLVREAVTAARFSHPNVVAVYDVAEAPEGAYIAMELVEGISLERLLLQRGRLRPAEVVPLGAAVARGLAAAHARDVVHRDVKPANVLLGRDGSIKVTDFGIADLIAATRADGLVFGTPGYLPPEALRGSGHDRTGDLFALGVVLYECLAGVKPFGGLEVSDMVQSTLFGAVKPLRPRVQGDLPEKLEMIILQLLERDPALRPSSAAAVAEELDRLAVRLGARWKLEERPGSGPTPSTEYTLEAQWVPTRAVR
ncbi:MAG: serine/threonine protein kinase [Thermoanaerobaculia bacterium]